jgi:hypothetical protein
MPRRDAPPPPKTLPNGVVVPPGIQVNELTLRELREAWGPGAQRLRRDEAERAGFPVEEIDREFGPAGAV